MLPRMRAATAAPSCGGAASSWPATAEIPPWCGEGSAMPIRACRRPPWARSTASARSRPTTWWERCRRVPRRCDAAPSRPRRACTAGARARTPRRAHPRPRRSRSPGGGRRSLVPGRTAPPAAVAALGATATGHGDTRCREAAVAALGAIGDPGGCPPCWPRSVTSRRSGDGRRWRSPASTTEVDPALRAAATDRDWQVRQAAEELLAPEPPEPREPVLTAS